MTSKGRRRNTENVENIRKKKEGRRGPLFFPANVEMCQACLHKCLKHTSRNLPSRPLRASYGKMETDKIAVATAKGLLWRP